MEISETMMSSCTLCPRKCGVNRINGERGCCGQEAQIIGARAALHHWEEPCISGTHGSGTVFFSGCPLHCIFCQNKKIADGTAGTGITVEHLAEIFLDLQRQKAENINLVTAGHFAPRVTEALKLSKKRGLTIPVVYNTSGYETVDTLRMLEGYVDIYLPDFKYWYSKTAQRYADAPDYPEVVTGALEEMYRQVKKPVFENGLMKKGVIVRHLILPEHVKEAKQILDYLHKTYGNNIYISIMNQYTPMPGIEKTAAELSRKVTKREYNSVISYALDLGIENGFIQEGETAGESFIPEFDNTGI